MKKPGVCHPKGGCPVSPSGGVCHLPGGATGKDSGEHFFLLLMPEILPLTLDGPSKRSQLKGFDFS